MGEARDEEARLRGHDAGGEAVATKVGASSARSGKSPYTPPSITKIDMRDPYVRARYAWIDWDEEEYAREVAAAKDLTR